MTANTDPRFTLTDVVSWTTITGVDGSTDGTDADVKLIITGGTNGTVIDYIRVMPKSTSGSTTMSTAVFRLYINNGSSVGTAANNSLIYEHPLVAQAVNVASTALESVNVIPVSINLPSGYRLYGGVTAMASNTAYDVTAFGADF